MARFTQPLQTPCYTAQLHRSSQRATLAVKIQQGHVHVYAPASLSLDKIVQWLEQKHAWIEKHLLNQKQRLSEKTLLPSRWQHGAEFYFLNTRLALNVQVSTRYDGHIQNDQLVLCAKEENPPEDILKQLAQHAYSNAGLPFIQSRLLHWCPQLNRYPTGVKIKHYSSRWGSCNARGEVSFNWLLFQAPESVVDYVIVHELCHLMHMNHSPAYWQLVARLCPDYLTHRNWLKHHSQHLTL